MASSVAEMPAVPERLLCPVCTELPEAEVYQCFNGHVLCKKCFSQVTSCPQCRVHLSRIQPIRCRVLEELLDELKQECLFKGNGCKEVPTRKSYQKHVQSCCYDFKKFGSFVNICELLGHQNCSFLVNGGNTMEAVTHLVAEHEITCSVIRDKQIVKVEITDFKNRCNPEVKSEGIWSWKPFILDLPYKLCYVLVTTVIKLDGTAFDLWALYLPYSNNPSLFRSPVQMDYSLFNEKSTEHPWKLNLGFSDLPMTLEEAVKQRGLNSGVALRLKTGFLKEQLTGDCETLVIDLSFGPDTISFDKNSEVGNANEIVPVPLPNPSDVSAVASLPTGRQNVKRSSNRPVWRPLCFHLLASKMMEEQIKLYKKDRKPFLPLLDRSLYNGKDDGAVRKSLKVPDHLPFLQYGSLFQAAKFGNVDAVKYVIGKKINLNVEHAETGETPLHWTMLDEDSQLGLEKAKLLVEHGADLKALNNQNWSVLHYAARYSDQQAVEYFIAKGVNVNGVTLEGCTPLRLAIQNRTDEDAAGVINLLQNWQGSSCNESVVNPFVTI